MKGLRVERCSAIADWEEFIHQSPQYSMYCSDAVIKKLSSEADYWFICKGDQILAGLPIVTANFAGSGLPVHSYYIGPMFAKDLWEIPAARRSSKLVDILSAALAVLTKHYNALRFSLHPSFDDVRAFDWFNYHGPSNQRIRIDVRYSAILQLSNFKQNWSHARNVRRQENGYAASRENLKFYEDGTPDELVSLWSESLSRQDIATSRPEIDTTVRFSEYLLEDDAGFIGVVRDASGKAQAAGLLMFEPNSVAHLPVVGTSTSRYGGTMLYWGLIESATKRRFSTLDFNGANSPQRGFYKHSFGASPTMYFDIAWQRDGSHWPSDDSSK